MSSDLARLLEDAAPDPQTPLDPELVWTAGRTRHRRRRGLAAALLVVVVVAGAAGLIQLGAKDPGPTVTADATQSRAAAPVEALAAADPLDVLADFGDVVDWHPPYGAEAGGPVTDDNAADAYGPAVELLEQLRERGWISAATQEWRYEIAGSDTGWSNIRITASRFESLSLADAGDFWTDADVTAVEAPEGMEIVCTTATDVSEQHYPGAYYNECNVTVGDTIWISISTINPMDGNSKIQEILGLWLAKVTDESPG